MFSLHMNKSYFNLITLNHLHFGHLNKSVHNHVMVNELFSQQRGHYCGARCWAHCWAELRFDCGGRRQRACTAQTVRLPPCLLHQSFPLVCLEPPKVITFPELSHSLLSLPLFLFPRHSLHLFTFSGGPSFIFRNICNRILHWKMAWKNSKRENW